MEALSRSSENAFASPFPYIDAHALPRDIRPKSAKTLSGWGGAGTLTVEDAQSIEREVPGVTIVSPELRSGSLPPEQGGKGTGS